MCRLYGLLSTGGTTPQEYLVDSANSLIVQSNVSKKSPQADGWGIGWHEDDCWLVEKGIGGAYEPSERKAFIAASKVAKPPVVIGHLRHASNPMKLPLEKLRGYANSQPFWYKNTIFAHNGWIGLPTETKRYLGKYSKMPKGVNDSEVFFYLLLKSMDDEKDVVGGYETSMVTLNKVWEEEGRPKSGSFGGLNVILSRSPNELWAFCYYKGDFGCSLGGGKRPYYEMCYTEKRGDLIVASEPMGGKPASWSRIKAGQYLKASLGKSGLRYETGSFKPPD